MLEYFYDFYTFVEKLKEAGQMLKRLVKYISNLLLMFRRSLLFTASPLRGSPPKKPKSFPVIHASQRGREETVTDYASLGMEFVPKNSAVNMAVPRIDWAPAPTTRPDLPFHIERAGPSRGIPVYTDYKGGRTKVITIVRKCSGDVLKLKSDLEKLTGNEVEVRPGHLRVDGNYRSRITHWIAALGL